MGVSKHYIGPVSRPGSINPVGRLTWPCQPTNRVNQPCWPALHRLCQPATGPINPVGRHYIGRVSRPTGPINPVGRHYIGRVSRPTGSINPVGRHYIGPVCYEAGS